MKSTERHKLKENEFARTVARARTIVSSRGRQLRNVLIGLVALILAVALYSWWRNAQSAEANERLAAALATYSTPVIPPAPPQPGSPPPLPRPGTFQSEEERLNASLPKFMEAANASPATRAGMTARFHAAGILAGLGKHGEAEQQYRQVIEQAGDGIYRLTGRLGLAQTLQAQGKFDEAIAIYTELSRDQNSPLPLDGILFQLGHAYARAGKNEDAVRSFTRVVDEFPQSSYAADARREIEESKKTS